MKKNLNNYFKKQSEKNWKNALNFIQPKFKIK